MTTQTALKSLIRDSRKEESSTFLKSRLNNHHVRGSGHLTPLGPAAQRNLIITTRSLTLLVLVRLLKLACVLPATSGRQLRVLVNYLMPLVTDVFCPPPTGIYLPWPPFHPTLLVVASTRNANLKAKARLPLSLVFRPNWHMYRRRRRPLSANLFLLVPRTRVTQLAHAPNYRKQFLPKLRSLTPLR
jgi:hypothetical protein